MHRPALLSAVGALVIAATAAVAAVVVPSAPARGAGAQLSLVAYSTPREAYGQLIPLFQKTPAGKDVSFTQSYGASGEQTRAVKAGLRADVVALSLAPDVNELVSSRLVFKGWQNKPYGGMVTDSVVVFVLRDGNPKHIKTWNDLLKPGIQVVGPNPFTSGGARWNVMAAYGAWRHEHKTDKQAQANLLKLFKNVVVQDKSARDALNTFVSGKGDVMLAYENEALFAQSKGQNLQFLIPRDTILIENPVAVTRTTENAREANAFVKFLTSPAAQQVFANNGYRPVVPSVLKANQKKFPVRPGQFTIDAPSIGGWVKAQKRFFDAKRGIMARIEKQVGGNTG
jgi:sulfate/thiosulfate transport system substrate-binding protein